MIIIKIMKLQSIQLYYMKYFIFISLLLTLLASYGCSNSGKKFQHGEEVTISQRCIGAVDNESYDLMNKYCNRRDERGLEIMESQGKIRIIEKGETGTITEMGFGKVKIRTNNNIEYWCANEFVK